MRLLTVLTYGTHQPLSKSRRNEADTRKGLTPISTNRETALAHHYVRTEYHVTCE